MFLNHGIFDGRSACRARIDDRNIQITVEDNRKGARYRSGAHHKHMGLLPLFGEGFPLLYAETVLFIGHNQRKR